jgi:hypothetical protein
MDDHEALKDIKDTVHRIDSEVRSYRDEQLRQRADIARMEARQETMHQVHVRLEQKIDTIGENLTEEVADVKASLGKGIDHLTGQFDKHTTKEDADRGRIIFVGWGLLLSILAYLGTTMFEHFLGAK